MRIFVTLILIVSCAVQADDIAEIMEYYNDVKAHLDDEYGLYRTEISINTRDGVYPVLGHYQEKITFYWNSEAGHDWPVLIQWSADYGGHWERGEVLFSTPEEPWAGERGELVFEFVSFNTSADIITESRWWFACGELLQSNGVTVYPEEEVDFIPDVPGEDRYAHSPTELMEMFNMIH